MDKLFMQPFVVAFDNSFDALNPEWWAFEGLAVLEENLVVANLVNRDYDEFFANAGDVVHINKAGTFSAKNKTQGSATSASDFTVTDTEVKLDQHIYSSVLLDDQELFKAPQDLFEYTIRPLVRSLAERVDAALIGQAGSFYTNCAGVCGTAITDTELIELNRIFNANNNPRDGRALVVGPGAEAEMLAITRYTEADKTGYDMGLQLNGIIGRAMGFDVYMSQTVGSTNTGGVTVTDTVNGAVTAGNTSITIDAAGADVPAGAWLKIAGVRGVYKVATALSADGTTLVVSPALKGAVADGVTITYWKSAGLTDLSGGYSAGAISIITDTWAAADDVPQAGDYISFGTGTQVYMVESVSGTWAASGTDMTLNLNRPLDAAVADGVVVNILPQNTGYNFAFRPDAMTLVNRPLAPARPGSGAIAALASGEGLSLRITVAYDDSYMRYRLTADTLLGVKVLDTAQGALLIN